MYPEVALAVALGASGMVTQRSLAAPHAGAKAVTHDGKRIAKGCGDCDELRCERRRTRQGNERALPGDRAATER
jgi:hypothetical protein